MRVLLVEDDPMIGAAMAQSLKDAAYAVDWVRDGQTALLTLQTHEYGLVLLDLGLPKKDGLAVLQDIRAAKNHVPVLIVTARDALDNRLDGLNSGADDYIVKPFDMAELLARMRAVIRRQSGQAAPLLSNGAITLNPTSREASLASGQGAPLCLRLSAKEYALLEALLIRPGAVLSRAALEDRLYGWGEEVESNAVEFLIHSLRKKLGFEAILNVRGVGWLVAKSA